MKSKQKKWYTHGHMEQTRNRMHVVLVVVAVASAAYEWHQSELLTDFFFRLKYCRYKAWWWQFVQPHVQLCLWHNEVCYANPLNEYIYTQCAHTIQMYKKMCVLSGKSWFFPNFFPFFAQFVVEFFSFFPYIAQISKANKNKNCGFDFQILLQREAFHGFQIGFACSTSKSG